MFGSIGSLEILVIFIVVLVLFGSKELPQVAKTLGKGVRDFQRATQNARDELARLIEEEENDEKKELKG